MITSIKFFCGRPSLQSYWKAQRHPSCHQESTLIFWMPSFRERYKWSGCSIAPFCTRLAKSWNSWDTTEPSYFLRFRYLGFRVKNLSDFQLWIGTVRSDRFTEAQLLLRVVAGEQPVLCTQPYQQQSGLFSSLYCTSFNLLLFRSLNYDFFFYRLSTKEAAEISLPWPWMLFILIVYHGKTLP